MDEATQARYDAGRDLASKGFRSSCYAPFVTLYLDQRGNARACCHNDQVPLGNVSTMRLREIWEGPAASALRAALIEYRFDRGCRFCAWQVAAGNMTSPMAVGYDRYDAQSPAPAWPQALEFSLSNACNLQCVMCRGEWSSSIRALREKLPPLPRVYDDRFFDDLREFLPHLRYAKFLGGEPFLAAENHRIWDAMAELGLRTPIHVTTNGTQWNARVERVLDRFPVSFSVSMDGATRETVERVRVGAKFDEVRANVLRFREYAKRRGTTCSLTYCLMIPNWREFAAYLRFADELDVDVYVNTVIEPTELSLYALPPDELADVVAALDREAPEAERTLRRNVGVWRTELDRLRNAIGDSRTSYFAKVRRDAAPEPAPVSTAPTFAWKSFPAERNATAESVDPVAALRRRAVDAVVHEVVADLDDRVVATGPDAPGFFGKTDAECAGRTLVDLTEVLRERFGRQIRVVKSIAATTHIERLVRYGSGESATCVRTVTVPRYDDDGRIAGTVTAAATESLPDAV